MTRLEFLELSRAVIGGFLLLQAPDRGLGAASGGSARRFQRRDDDSYLVKGLTAMVRARGWFEAHWGAAVLAGHYLCSDNDLGDELIGAVHDQLDTLIGLRAAQFAPLPQAKANAELIEEIPKALRPALQGGLRAHGHAVIFASLSIRALRDVGMMARPQVIEGLCQLSREIGKKRPLRPPQQVGGAAYPSSQAMIEATFRSLSRFRPLVGHPEVRRPNFTHMVTHTEALWSLQRMGYGELAVAGHSGLRAHIHAPVPKIPDTPPGETHRVPGLPQLLQSGFWRDERRVAVWKREWNQNSNPNGYWVAFGHLFKVLYSFHRLIRQVEDRELRKVCSEVLLERYVDPRVQGG